MEVWNFIQNQILGMKWLNTLIGDLLSKFGLDLESRIGGSLQFFFYDVIKIFILLSVIYALSDFLIMILSWLVKQSLRAFLFQEVQP